MAWLKSANDSVVKQKIELGRKPISIGRHPECDIIIDNGSVSRHHAKIVNESGSYFVQDLDSRNGTFVNGSQIHNLMKLYDGSEIQICDVKFHFFLSDQMPPTPVRPTVDPGSHGHSSIVMEEDDDEKYSTIMSQLDVPSHHSHLSSGHVSAEDKLQALIKITHAVSEAVTQAEILDNILTCLFDLFVEADRGFIVLKMDDGRLRPVGMKTRRPQDEELIKISRTIVDTVMQTKRPLISSDAATDSRFDMSQSIADFRIRSIMCAPLINSKDEPIGVIQLDTLKRSIAFSEEDLEIMVTVAMQASLAIQKSDLFEEAKKADDFESDLALAHELQQRFLPQRSPAIDEYSFFSYYKPMQQVGGDYFDYVTLDDNRLAIIVADVVGHGIAAALMMAKVSAESRFALATEKDPVKAVAKMNNKLSGLNLDRFVTLVLAMIDLRDNSLTVVNAGHMPPIFRTANSGNIEMVAFEESGLPLGILPDYEYESCTLQIEPGDALLMYTDGINEAMDADGNQLTTETIVKEIKDGQVKTAEAIGNLVCDSVARHVGMEPAIDDMCLVCLDRKPI